MILEGIVTTTDQDGRPNISPMGPLVDEQMTQFVLRPYQTSRTYRNLKHLGHGVLHVTDDVDLIARAAINRLEVTPKLVRAKKVSGFILADACRWYEFDVTSLDDSAQRTTIACRVVGRGRIRDFFGFNRAKHAVVEAAILATRVGILPGDQIRDEFKRLSIPVEKTAGRQERCAFAMLQQHVDAALAAHESHDMLIRD